MRLAYILLAVIIINSVSSLSNQDHVSLSVSNHLVLPESHPTYKKNTISSQRSLRLHNNVKTDEERGIVDELSSKLILAMKTDPKVVFKSYHLAKQSTKLDNNPAFFKWVEYVRKYWKKYGDARFSERSMLALLLSRSDDDLAAAFHSLRRVPDMETFADKMQTKLFMVSKSSHDAMNQAWLASRESPQEVFRILDLGKHNLETSPLTIQWLKYIKLYRVKMGDSAFTDTKAALFIEDATYSVQAQKFGVLLQSLKETPDLKMLAENMQTSLFHQWINVMKMTPNDFGSLIVSPHGSWKKVVGLPKSDPRFQALETYTVQYAARTNDKDLVEKVKMLFLNNDPEAALVAAMKTNGV